MRSWKEDHAVSPVVGTILLVAVTVALGAVVYATVSGTHAEKPQALAIAGAAGGSDTAERTFTVASSSDGMRWGGLEPALDAVPLAYDGALSSEGTWCRVAPGGACVPTSSYDPDEHVRAGQELRIHHASIAGRTLQLRDTQANAILVSVTLR